MLDQDEIVAQRKTFQHALSLGVDSAPILARNLNKHTVSNGVEVCGEITEVIKLAMDSLHRRSLDDWLCDQTRCPVGHQFDPYDFGPFASNSIGLGRSPCSVINRSGRIGNASGTHPSPFRQCHPAAKG